MVSCNQVSENSSFQSQFIDGMDCTCRGVIDSPRHAFDVSFGIVPAYGFDVLLEFFAEFSEVVPEPSQVCPIHAPKKRGEIARKTSYFSQMIFKEMLFPAAIGQLAHMRQWTLI